MIIKVYLRVADAKVNDKTDVNVKIKASNNTDYEADNKPNNIVKKGL